jgi:hypothetical protein
LIRPLVRPMLGSVSLLALSLHAYTPATRLHTSLPPACHQPAHQPAHRSALSQRPPLMIVPKGNSDPNFDPDNVDPDAVRRTVVKTGVVWAVVGSVVALVTSSGKEFNSENAPGYAEASAKKAAAKKASLDAYNARVKELEAKRDSGAPPSKPWEK